MIFEASQEGRLGRLERWLWANVYGAWDACTLGETERWTADESFSFFEAAGKEASCPGLEGRAGRLVGWGSCFRGRGASKSLPYLTVPYRTLPHLTRLGGRGRISVNLSWALLTSLGLTLPHRFRCSEQV